MAQFYTPEQWAQLSDEDKKSFFKGLWDGGNPFDLIAPTAQPMVAQDPQLSVAGTQPPVVAPPAPVVAPVAPAPVPLGSALGNQAENVSVPSRLSELSAPESTKPQMVTEGIQTSTVSGVPGTKAMASEMKAAGAEAVEAQKKIGENRALAALAERKQREESGVQMQQLESKRLVAEADRTKALAETEAEVRAAAEEAKAMRVDPNKFYHDRGTLGTILAALSVGAGAYASAMTGGRNYALDIIENAIARDIDAQKSAIEGKRADVAEKRNLFQTMRQRFGDERQAEEAAKNAMRQSIVDKLEDTRAIYDAKGIPFANDKELAAMRQQITANEFNMIKEGATKTTTTVAQKLAGPTGAVEPLKVKDWRDEHKTLIKDKAALEGYDAMAAAIEKNPELLGRLNAFSQETSRLLANVADKDYETFKAQRNAQLFRMASGISGAAYSEKELERFETIIPKLAGNPENVKAQLKILRNDAARDYSRNWDAVYKATPQAFRTDMEAIKVRPTQEELQTK
jgi:hypothetical protein